MTRTILLCSAFLAASSLTTEAAGLLPSKWKFFFKDKSGQTQSAQIVSEYRGKIVYPFARIDRRIDPTLLRAASIADERAHARSKKRCWHYVKEALVASGAVSSYPRTAYARQAGEELVRMYGFRKLAVNDPYDAPLGAVLVYSHGNKAGHVEIRTKDGFVSDYHSKTHCRYPLIAVYGKFSS